MEKKKLKGYFSSYIEKALHKHLLGKNSTKDEGNKKKKIQLGANGFAHTPNKKEQHLLTVKFNSPSYTNPTPYGKDNSKLNIAGLMTAREI